MTTALPTPVRTDTAAPAASRLLGVDAARGLAVLGMMAVHSLYDTDPDGGASLSYSVTGGRSAAVFALLAGVGIAFTTGRRPVRGAVAARRQSASLLVRGLVVGAIGLVLLGWTDAELAVVILPYYALMFVLAIPLVFLPTGALVALGTAIAVGVPVLSQIVRPGLSVPDLENPSPVTLVTDPLGLLSELALTGAYPAVPWLAYLCAGIAIGRLRLSSTRTAAWLLGAGAALAVAAHTVSWWLMVQLGGLGRIAAVTDPGELADSPSVADFVEIRPEGVTPTTTWWWLGTDAPHSATPLDLFQTTGSAAAVLGLTLLLGHVAHPVAARVVAWALRPLAAVGALTLTVYVLSVMFLNSPLDQFDAVPGYLVQVLVAALFAVAWRQAVGRGPLESLVRVVAQAAGRAAAGRGRS